MKPKAFFSKSLLLLIFILVCLALLWSFVLDINITPFTTSVVSPIPDISRKPNSPDATIEWRVYRIKTIGLLLKLPPNLSVLGELQEQVNPGEKGTLLCITFRKKNSREDLSENSTSSGISPCKLQKFAIGTTSRDYQAGRGMEFLDYQGYILKNGTYYIKAPLRSESKVPSELVSKIVNQHGVEILKIEGEDIYDPWQQRLSGTPGEGNVGAIINLDNDEYTGITIQMEINEELTDEMFERILSTIVILD